MLLFRALGWLLLALAVTVTANDALSWWSEGSFRLMSLGDLWSKLDPGSLDTAQSSVQRFASAGLWNWVAQPVLVTPAIPLFAALGILLLWLGGAGGATADAGFAVGARSHRRRRGRRGLE